MLSLLLNTIAWRCGNDSQELRPDFLRVPAHENNVSKGWQGEAAIFHNQAGHFSSVASNA